MQDLARQTLKRFESRPRDRDSCDLFGTSIITFATRYFIATQEAYIRRLKPLPVDVSFEQFRSYQAISAWDGYNRHNVLCSMKKAAQVTANTFHQDNIEAFNNTISYPNQSPSRYLQYTSLNKDSLHIRIYAEASFPGKDEFSSHLGFIILLSDSTNSDYILEYSSRNYKRIVGSILGGEVYALADGIDRAFVIRCDLQTIPDKIFLFICSPIHSKFLTWSQRGPVQPRRD